VLKLGCTAYVVVYFVDGWLLNLVGTGVVAQVGLVIVSASS
jgi:hypothetical protein